MIPIMGMAWPMMPPGSLAALTIAVGIGFLAIYRLGIHAINKVSENATVVKYKDGEIRFRPPKD